MTNKKADQSVHLHSPISVFVVCSLDSIISVVLHPKFYASSYLMKLRASLCLSIGRKVLKKKFSHGRAHI